MAPLPLDPSPPRSCFSLSFKTSFHSPSRFPSPLPSPFRFRSSAVLPPAAAAARKPEFVPKRNHVKCFSSVLRIRHDRPRGLQVSANSKAEDPLPSEMSLENALEILGVAEGASFEEILRAKNNLLGKHSGDQEIAIQVEAAYDVLLMQRLMQRRTGKVVDNSVRFADVKKAKANSGIGGPKWFTEALSKIPVAVETPSTSTIGTQTAVYAGLIVWTFASGLSSQPSVNVNADVPGVILAIGFGASIYFLRKQNVNLGKAAVLTVASLVAGSVLGGAVESWLRVDLIPVFGIGSPAVVVSEFVLISLWLSSLYLR